MAEDDLKRKLATIMVADIIAYSRLTAQDEDWTIRALGEFRAIVDDIIARHDGRIFNTGGDSVLAEFASPVEAVRCAVDFQEAARSRNLLRARDRQLRFRIGINLGDVMVRGSDLLGDGVNVAARLEGLAEPGGICVSGTVWDHIQGKLSIGYVDIGEQSVKNIPRPVRAFHLRVDGGSEEVAVAPAAALAAPAGRARPAPAAAAPRRRNLFAAPLLAVVVVVIVAGGAALWALWPGERSSPPDGAAAVPASPGTPPAAATAPAAAVPSSLLQALSERLKAVVPQLGDEIREGAIRAYVNARVHKAQALSLEPPGLWFVGDRATIEEATDGTLENCQLFHGHPCVLIVVDDMLRPLPADGKPVPQDMPRLRYAGDFDPAQLPGGWDPLRKRADVIVYVAAASPKAATYHPSNSRLFIITKAATQRAAEAEALQACNDDTASKKAKGPCFLYAVGNRVVLPLRLTEPLTPATAAPPPPPATAAAPPAPAVAAASLTKESLLARLTAVLPGLSETAREAAVREFTENPGHKAQAVSLGPPGYWSVWNQPNSTNATEMALEGCQVFFGHPCAVIAVDDTLQPLAADGKPPQRDAPRVVYEGNFDPAQLPGAWEGLRKRGDLAGYSGAPAPKAVSYHPARARYFVVTQAVNQRAAEDQALKACNDDTTAKNLRGQCFLYAVENRVVLPRRLTAPLTAAVK